jgi:hypothetical protein
MLLSYTLGRTCDVTVCYTLNYYIMRGKSTNLKQNVVQKTCA